MEKILEWCKEKGIVLNKRQRAIELRLSVKEVFSEVTARHYLMIYARTNVGLKFIYLFANGSVSVEDGYDGGDLSKYKALLPKK